MITKYITKYSSNCEKCACILAIPTFVFFHCMHADEVGQHFNLRPNFEL